ncbi:hypothetical protein HLH44_21140 [Gluconacetobacter sp. 1c LMG 22058]|uniref:Uncharacterized protein n=1 Tax=Gluconacetobacter dulcium TaxID=2729096 RepID=A0A7W4K420_9PROT|nr:hypothetical protein [Gluconacetobacter dulcium]MBB2199893.1 hypothetical protein [Gluconacetobacter dulcium]
MASISMPVPYVVLDEPEIVAVYGDSAVAAALNILHAQTAKRLRCGISPVFLDSAAAHPYGVSVDLVCSQTEREII